MVIVGAERNQFLLWARRNKSALWGLGWCLHDRSLVKTQNCALERGTSTICKLYLKIKKHVKKKYSVGNQHWESYYPAHGDKMLRLVN